LWRQARHVSTWASSNRKLAYSPECVEGEFSEDEMSSIPPAKCQKLMLEAPAEGRTSFEVRMLEGEPDCPYNNVKDFEACYEKIGYRAIRGPWKFEFKVPSPAGGAGPEWEADD
jgi:hypothetical protein